MKILVLVQPTGGSIFVYFVSAEVAGNPALLVVTNNNSIPQITIYATDNRLSIQVSASNDVTLSGLYGKYSFLVVKIHICFYITSLLYFFVKV